MPYRQPAGGFVIEEAPAAEDAGALAAAFAVAVLTLGVAIASALAATRPSPAPDDEFPDVVSACGDVSPYDQVKGVEIRAAIRVAILDTTSTAPTRDFRSICTLLYPGSGLEDHDIVDELFAYDSCRWSH